jgi:hypothetical protein
MTKPRPTTAIEAGSGVGFIGWDDPVPCASVVPEVVARTPCSFKVIDKEFVIEKLTPRGKEGARVGVVFNKTAVGAVTNEIDVVSIPVVTVPADDMSNGRLFAAAKPS